MREAAFGGSTDHSDLRSQDRQFAEERPQSAVLVILNPEGSSFRVELSLMFSGEPVSYFFYPCCTLRP